MQKLFSRNLQLLGKASHFSKMQFQSGKIPSYLLSTLDLGLNTYYQPYHQTQNYFSTKSDDPNRNDHTANSGIPPKYRPQTMPMREFKSVLNEESDHEIKRYVLFTSTNPIFPNNKIKATINTGNLNLNQFENEILYVLTSESHSDEIYTVGVILHSDINQQLEQNLKGGDKTIYDSITSPKKVMITPKKQNFRVKITEIEMTKSGNFVKGYVIKDDELTEEEKMINLKSEVSEMHHVCNSIRNIMQENVFNINFDIYERNDLNVEKLDELLFILMNQIWNMNNLTKENFPEFAQAFLEQTSVIVRLFMLKKKLNEMFRVAIMVAKSVKYAEDTIRKRNEAAKAQLSIQYLESTYLGSQQAKPSQQGFDMGTSNPTTAKLKAYRDKLVLIKDESSREKVKKEIDRVAQMDKHSSEYSKILTYLEEVFNVPWEKYSYEHWDVEYTRKVLEEGLYGLEKVKERIIELVASNKLRDLNEKNPKKGIVICLYGPPGTGKTSIAKHLAKALNREMRLISFAGVTDLHFIKGHRRTYVDSQPGVFVRELIKAKTMNPVFVLDEIDKMGRYGQGADPYYSLLEILNHEENHNFVDHYLDIKVDFSRIVFVLTANQTLNMLEPLRNRLEIIEVPAYIDKEKLTISKEYLLPKVLDAHGLLPDSIEFDDESILKIIKGWCYYESGVRELKRCFEKIARKFAHDLVDSLIKKPADSAIPAEDLRHNHNSDSWLESKIHAWGLPVSEAEGAPKKDNVINLELKVMSEKTEETTSEQKAPELVENNKLQTVQTIQNQPNKEDASNILEARSSTRIKFVHDDKNIEEELRDYLGLPAFDEVYERISRKSYIGVCNVLTVSGFSGHVMSVEVIYDITNPEKKNNYTLTGNLKQVLQESLSIAKINALNLLPKDKLEETMSKNYHIHFLQGSSPKDGPSAGISVCTALLSRMLEKPVPSSIAMTGELSLNGDIYKIGGLQSKLIAAKSLDIKTILVPHGNKSEFIELPDALKEGLTVYFVKNYKEVYDIVFSEDSQAVDKIDQFVGTKTLSKRDEQLSLTVEKQMTMS